MRIKNRILKKWSTRKKAAAALVILLGAGGIFAFQRVQNAKQAAAAGEAARTASVTRGSITSELSSSGVIAPKDTYSITSLVEGEVILADFEEGDQVEEGQVLYQIDASSMESELQSANTSLERANKNYASAQEDYAEAAADYSGNTYKSTRAGFIKSLSIEAGDKVSSGTQLASIYNDKTMRIKVPFLSGEAALIAAGQQAVLILSDTGEQLAGVVTSVSSMDEALDGGRLVRYVTVETENPGGLTSSHQASAEIAGFRSAGEGGFDPVTDTVMSAEVTGNGSLEVESLLVHEGDYVTAGTPIFRIKSSDVADILENFQDAVDTAEENIQSAQSKLDSTQDSYDNYTITAPISGQVITKSVKAGDTVSRNSGSSDTTLAVIYDLSELTFEMSVDELDVRNVQVGQKVEVTADALEGQTFTGTVTNVSLESTQSNGVTNYPVTVTLDETGDLLPGMNVDGVIILDQAEDVLMIPVDSLMRGNQVYVKDNTVKEPQGGVPAGFKAVEVETGLTSDSYVEIISGLSEGEEVYVDESSTDTSDMFQMGGGPGGGRP
ncbi:MAG: efflux RND transporter periplasmic adaptor subunit [Eubacteriales bacterium]|nr:efflux RND transporter periplasmic adaptor subunit [Eubacteriales bacterium]